MLRLCTCLLQHNVPAADRDNGVVSACRCCQRLDALLQPSMHQQPGAHPSHKPTHQLPCPVQAAGEKAVLDAFPDATIFKPGPLVGQEDKLYNTYAKMGKALPIFPLIGGGTARRQVGSLWQMRLGDSGSQPVLGEMSLDPQSGLR